MDLQTKFGRLYEFFAIFLLRLIQRNSAAVITVWKYHKNVIIFYF